MALSEKSPIQEIIVTNLKIEARVEPDDAVNDLLPVITKPHAEFMVHVGARNKAENVLLKAEGRRNYRRAKLVPFLVPFGLKVAGHFGSRVDAGYTRIFLMSPSEIGSAPERDMPVLVTSLVAAINANETPAELKKAAAPLLAAATAYLTESTATTKAAFALVQATEEVAKGRSKCLDAQASLRGALQARFPRKPKIVAAYFPPAKKAGKKAAAAVEAPVVAAQDTQDDAKG